MSLRTTQNLCRLLSIGSSICLLLCLVFSLTPLLYPGVLGTFAHAWLNLSRLRCPYCRGRLAGVSAGSNCPHCGQPLPWD